MVFLSFQLQGLLRRGLLQYRPAFVNFQKKPVFACPPAHPCSPIARNLHYSYSHPCMIRIHTPVYDSERNGAAELSTIEELSLELFQYRPLGKRDNTSAMKPERDGELKNG
jgi:hypothetical protein